MSLRGRVSMLLSLLRILIVSCFQLSLHFTSYGHAWFKCVLKLGFGLLFPFATNI